VLYIPAIGGKNAFGFFEQVFVVAEFHHISRADGNACRCITVFDTVTTHRAFRKYRYGLAPFKFGNAKGAGEHTVPASNAEVRIIDNWSCFGFSKCGGKARGNACRLLAVQTLSLDESPFFGAVLTDGRILVNVFTCFRANSALLHDRPIRVGKFGILTARGSTISDPLVIVIHFACHGTTAATDALGQINENTFRHRTYLKNGTVKTERRIIPEKPSNG
jgi:hypothetical protein